MDMLFQLLFNELLNPPPNVDHPAPEVVAPIDEVSAPEPAVSTGSPSSTTVDQDAPSPSNSQTTPDTQPPVIPNDVEEDNHDIEVAHMGNDLRREIDFEEETFDRIARLEALRIFLACAASFEHGTWYSKDSLIAPQQHLQNADHVFGKAYDFQYWKTEYIALSGCCHLQLRINAGLSDTHCSTSERNALIRDLIGTWAVVWFLILERVNCVLRISGLYTSRLLDAAVESSESIKKGLLKVEAMPKSAWIEKDQIDNFLKERRLLDGSFRKVRWSGVYTTGDYKAATKNYLIPII
ncbi:hypothetical protein Tco_0303982 [Tanacetum coccineum]